MSSSSLVNPYHVKNLPGRKTDVADAVWLAQLLECGLLRGSFVAPPVIARLRDLTRYRKKLIEDRAREVQRVQKALEIAGVKLDSVVSDVLGKAGRRMLEALITGERDVEVIAEMAVTRMRPKIPQLQLALESRFDDHNALMVPMHFTHIDHLVHPSIGSTGRWSASSPLSLNRSGGCARCLGSVNAPPSS